MNKYNNKNLIMMRKQLLLLCMTIFSLNAFSQAPEIDGDVLMCPWEDGTATITNNQTYDSYQWYFKYWFLPDAYQPIDGANSESFTYDWYTYDQALLKVEVTLNGVTYESNAIQIDSWAWSSLFMSYDLGENASFDPITETILLCAGTSLEVGINNPPYNASIEWYKDGVLIEGANESTYAITGPGSYQVSAAPDFCPNNSSNSLALNVDMDSDCSLGIDEPNVQTLVQIYPNPVENEFNVVAPANTFESYTLLDMTGKMIVSGTLSQAQSAISIATLSEGMYLLHLMGQNQASVHKIIKK